MSGFFGDISSGLSFGAGQSIRRNAGDTAFESFTPSSYSLPSMSGNSGKILTNNGTSESWGLNIAEGLNVGTADGDSAYCGIMIKTSRTYPFFVRKSDGTNLMYVDNAGNMTLAGGITFTGTPTINVNSGELRGAYFQDASAAQGYFSTIDSGIDFAFHNRVAGNILATFNAHASQTANILEVRGLSSKKASFDKDANLELSDGVNIIAGTSTGTKIGTGSTQKFGFFNVTPVAQQTVTGSRSGNAALQNLLTALQNLGLIIDSTS